MSSHLKHFKVRLQRLQIASSGGARVQVDEVDLQQLRLLSQVEVDPGAQALLAKGGAVSLPGGNLLGDCGAELFQEALAQESVVAV